VWGDKFMEWVELSKRFRAIADKTGMGKTSSYDLSVNFCGVDGLIDVHLFTYDIADWPRHTTMNGFKTDTDARLATLKKIEDAELAVKTWNYDT
jgi:hypothetical protein